MAQDLYLTGAKDITIVQREKTFIIPREYLAGILSGECYFLASGTRVT